jgi:hypothetical protein
VSLWRLGPASSAGVMVLDSIRRGYTTLRRRPQTNATWGSVLRTSGFVTASGLLAVAGMFRALAGIAVFTVALYILIAFVLAAKQALGYSSTPRAVLVCLVAWFVNVTILLLLLSPPR